MKRFTIAVLLVAAMVVSASMAQASMTTITFGGSDIVAPASLTVNTSGTPIVGDGYIKIGSSVAIRTYESNPEGTSGNPSGFNSWLSGLTAEGQGLSGFNLWLQDGRSGQAALWGEDIALESTDSIVPFAPTGWSGSVIDCPWGGAFTGGKLIVYTANTSADYLRPNNVPEGLFGFTADLMGYDGGTGPDYQMWVGAGNAAQSDTGVDQLAGVVDGVYFQRAITANTVPEPASLIVWSLLGVLGIGAAWRRR